MRVIFGRRARASMDIACSVFTTQSASAPASAAARAIAAMSVTFGVSFTITGSVVDRTTAAVTAAAVERVLPELHAAALRVGAADVQLEAGDARHAFEARGALAVLIDAARRGC